MASEKLKYSPDGVPIRPAVVASGFTIGSVTDKIASVVLTHPVTKGWVFWLRRQLHARECPHDVRGVAVLPRRWNLGHQHSVGWGFAIVNFVWWIGIGHAGTFISAFLLLLRQDWRTSHQPVCRSDDAFCRCVRRHVSAAASGPSVGCVLAAAVSEHDAALAAVPQPAGVGRLCGFDIRNRFAALLVRRFDPRSGDDARSSQKHFGKMIYGMFAMGWRGSARHWQRYQLGVHSAGRPGGAAGRVGAQRRGYGLRRGTGARLALDDFSAVLRRRGHLQRLCHGADAGHSAAKVLWAEGIITIKHIENCAKLMLVTGMIVAYGYTIEWVMGWYSGNIYEWFMISNRALGPYKVYYYCLIFCNILTPQLMWFKAVRQNPGIMWIIAFIIQCGMWLERFVIVITSLSRDFMPSSWGMYHPTIWDIATLAGTIGFFFSCIFLFVRVLPAISIFEMQELVHTEGGDGHH
jgi:hypothetical protein